MHRFFVDSDYNSGESATISGKDYNHIKNSLRLKIGDRVILSNGSGIDMVAEIIDYQEDKVLLNIISSGESEAEAKLEIYIAQGLPKKSKMDLIVEKATEIGFYGLIPLESSRSIVKYNSQKKSKKLARWQRVAEAAAKQSGRGIIPDILEFRTLEDLMEIRGDFDHIITFWEETENLTLKQYFTENIIKNRDKLLVIIGPEGGFSTSEVEFLKNELQADILTLGPRIMRTETAGIVALSCLLYEKGEFGDEND
ncbi:MAG: RsmE family RNA methyltransferase [Bacillota bacterium]